jgi:hypothetical protein
VSADTITIQPSPSRSTKNKEWCTDFDTMIVRLQAEAEEVVLRGGERMRVRLRFRGLRPGLLSVTGVKWLLDGAAQGYKSLKLRQLPQPRSR